MRYYIPLYSFIEKNLSLLGVFEQEKPLQVLVSDDNLIDIIIYIGINCLMVVIYITYVIITCNNVPSVDVGVWYNYFLSYAKPRPQKTMNRGSMKSPFSIAVVRVIPKRTANERIPINLHLGSTLFFLNQSIIDAWMISYLSLKRKKPVMDEHNIPNNKQPVQLETDDLAKLSDSTIYVVNTNPQYPS